MKHHWLLLVVAVLAVTAGVAWWAGTDLLATTSSGSTPGGGAAPTVYDAGSVDDLVLVESRLAPDASGVPIIKGTIRHAGTRPYGVVEARFELLAANGTPIGVASAYRNDLAPNDTWAFEAVAFDPATASYRLLEIVAD